MNPIRCFVFVLSPLCLSIALLSTPITSFAGDLAIMREVFVERGDIPNPRVIVRTHANGFVIAGNHGDKEAWATRVDAEGRIEWRYVKPVQRSFEGGPNYSSAAVMPDDSVFLCGTYPVNGSHGLLAHLDKAGMVLNEESLYPTDGHLAVARFDACMPWQHGVAIVGVAWRPLKTPRPAKLAGGPPIFTEPFYWVMAVDGDGKVKWEKLIPIDENGGIDEMAIFHQPLADGGFLFTGVGKNTGTEIIHVGRKGDVLAKAVFPAEALTPVQPIDDKDRTFQLASTGTEKFTVITLNKDLQEVKRLSERHERGRIYTAYRMPDQSLVLFGTHRLPANYEAWVMKLNPTLQDEQDLYFPPPNANIWIRAAVPLDTPGDFATARLVAPSNLSWKDEYEIINGREKKGAGIGLTAVHVNYNEKQQ
ncbi:hypothetical protein [Bradyrhizobium sp. LA7.1]|uniref:hypothetical protein n=1 Tax=Bradyrhizobium sp. LA7.1 TaxID=3156324 RepID=UPI003395731E